MTAFFFMDVDADVFGMLTQNQHHIGDHCQGLPNNMRDLFLKLTQVFTDEVHRAETATPVNSVADLTLKKYGQAVGVVECKRFAVRYLHLIFREMFHP